MEMQLIDKEPTPDIVSVVRCRDCKYRGYYDCPMYYEETIEWDDDGYTEWEDIVHDNTHDNGFCDMGVKAE